MSSLNITTIHSIHQTSQTLEPSSKPLPLFYFPLYTIVQSKIPAAGTPIFLNLKPLRNLNPNSPDHQFHIPHLPLPLPNPTTDPSMTSRASISSSSYFAPPLSSKFCTKKISYHRFASRGAIWWCYCAAPAIITQPYFSCEMRKRSDHRSNDKSKHQAEQNKAKRRKLTFRQHWRPSWCVRIYTSVDLFHGVRRFEYMQDW